MKIIYPNAFTALCFGVFFLLSSCSVSSTQMRHSGDFSKIRSEVFLEDGSSFLAYTSFGVRNGQHIKVQLPGERHERDIPLHQVKMLKMEDHEFVVRLIQTPMVATRQGRPSQTRAVLKRLGMEADAVQVFEYKFEVNHPKSPLPSLQTAYFVSFLGDPVEHPMNELGSPAYKAKWDALILSTNPDLVSVRPPQSVKGLLDDVKKLNLEEKNLAENILGD